ncbi:transglycosylase family protein [Tsukamurella sp. DT100]|uniref:transglycosylase family protein n=1 Tax=Tsukamurella sp. DT100 TaxID=3393415 RepID=UPI003CF69E6E
MTAPGGTFAEANVKATLTWDDIERLMTPRVEAEMKRAEKVVAKHLNNIEAAFGRTADRMADAFAHGMNQAARTVDRELAGIERRLRTSRLSVTVDVKVDSAAVERQLASQNMTGLGAAQGRKFSAGFLGALSAGLGAVSQLFAGGMAGAESRFARIALGTKVAALAAGQLAKKVLLVGGALGGLGAGALTKLAAGLKIASRFAGQLARDLTRVIALVTVLQAVGRGIGMLGNLGKFAAVGTMGFSALLGVATGVSQLLGGPLLSAITAVGAAMGVAAGAAAGILGPALVALKVGFKGLSDGAKKFNEQFKAMDDALSERIGNMMAPLLTAWHDASSQMKLAFAGALQPAFKSMGGLVSQFRPQLVGLSTTLGEVGNEVAKSLAGPAAKQGFADMLAASNTFFSAFKGESGLGGLSSGLVSFAGTAAKTFAGVGGGINEALLDAGEWLRNISPDQMRAAFDQLRQVFDNIAAVVGPVLSGLRQLGGISAPALAPGFQAIGKAIVEATPGIMQMARELMPALGQVMTNLAPLLPSLVQAFTPWASVVAVLAPHIATLVSHLGPLAPIILGLALAVKGIGTAMVVWNAAMAAASIAQGVFAAATGAGTASLAGNTIALTAHRVAMVAGTIATNAAAAAARIFNAVLAMNPIGLIITAIAALVAGLVWFFTQTETGRKVWETCWNAIKAAAAAVVSWFTDTALPFLAGVWEAIKTGWNTLVASAEAVWTGVKDKFNQLVNFIASIPDKIRSTASGMWDGISNAFKSTVNAMIRVWNNFASKLSFSTPDWIPGIGGKTFSIPTIAEFAEGGWTGPGSKYKAAGIVHADEFVLSKNSRGSIEGKFPGLLDFMNRTGTLPGYDTGGLVGNLRSAVSGIVNSGYTWGGWGNGWNTDCSGATSSVANIATGKASGPGQGERTATGGMGAFLAARGFQAGRGPAGSLRIGWDSQHSAGTLPDGTNFEHTGPQGSPGKFGAGAQGAGSLANEMWLPMGGDPSGTAGPVVGTGATASTSAGTGSSSVSSSSTSSSSSGGTKRTAQQELARIPLAALESAFGIKIPEWLDPTIQQQTEQATTANTAAVTANTQAIAQQTTATTTAPPAATGPASVPLTQNADGTWTSSNPEWAKLIKRESGGKADIVQGIQDANSGGNEASGLFQIAKGTWKGSGGTKYAATAGQATPQQQAEIAAAIFNRDGGSPWGAGLSGRESEAGLRAGITVGAPASSPVPFQQTPTVNPTATGPGMPLPVTQATGPVTTPTLNRTGEQTGPQLITGDTGTSNNTGGDLIASGIGYAGDTTKEIVGQFLAPFGLDGLFGKGVDIATNGAKGAAAQAQKAAQAGVQAASAAGAATGNPALVAAGAVGSGATAVINQNVTAYDPKDAQRQLVRSVGGQSLVTNTLRSP